ncbi:MAG: hypothetical protein K0S48_95 [Ramlibacter sp.]|jgi:hypothetical protein|nr:hypothetical protein [Ramlibacter sp.]MCE3270121.1 hypothetical protein [Ramlibacter sp.]
MQQQIPTSSPWWRFPFVWLVIAGPAAVVVAGFVTAFIAVSGADPVIATDYYRRGMEINKTLAAGSKASLPAMQGRNHAATPTAP